MGRIGRIGIVALCLLALAGCGAEAEKGIETVVSAPRRTASTACDLEWRTIETAVEAYRAVHGEPPSSTDDLVLEILKERPTYVEVAPDGTLRLTAEAERLGCTTPSG